MELYVLNESFQRLTCIDVYKSFIWTDRYQECGDFELVLDVAYKDAFVKNYYLQCDLSDRLMIIESIQIDTDVEEGNFLTVSGRSLESILERRVVWKQTTLDGTLQAGVKTLIEENIISPEDTDRTISNFVFVENSDTYFTSTTLSAQYTGDNLYDVICDICADKKVGFKVVLNASNQFAFSLFQGVDRSYEQLTNPYVIFSPNFENIISSQYVSSLKDEKNVSLILGEDSGSERRRATTGSGSGLSRKELYVDARDIQSDTGNIVTEDEEGVTSYTKFDEKTYFDYSDGTVKTHASDVYKAIKIPAAANTVYTLTRSYTLENTYLMIGGFSSEPAVGSTCLTDQKWNLQFTFDEEAEEGETRDTGGYVTFTTGDSVTWLVITLNDSTTLSETFDDLLELLQINGVLTDSAYETLLTTRGTEKMAEHKAIDSFEGEAEYRKMYKYGTDFSIGDICQFENEYDMKCRIRISELIISEDSSGLLYYPTFTQVEEEEDTTTTTT